VQVLLITSLLFLMPEWVDSWANYPGLELWKFINLTIFIVCALLLHRKFGRPIREAFRSRGENIRLEMLKAQKERDEALAKLAEVEDRFAKLDKEVEAIREKARLEAEGEKQRIAAATEEEMSKVREQAKREIENAGKAARQELRAFAAVESIRIAEEILKKEIRPEDDARLTSRNVEEFGRTRA
jgi:F-type H+-transporting ATPase subunit b